MEGSPDPGPLEHSVPEVILERSSRKKLSALELLEHSVPEVILERSSRRELFTLEPLEHSVPDVVLERNSGKEVSALEPLEHSGLSGNEVEGRRSVSLEPLEHSVLGTPHDQRDVSSSDDDLRVDSQSVVLDDRGVDVAPLVGCPEAARPPPEAGDAIIVGAVGSAAPWFLTGWAHEVEVEFMTDTGC